MNSANIPEAAYLLASLLFIFGLKRLSSPRTARSGNMLAGIGMVLALGGTAFQPKMGNLNGSFWPLSLEPFRLAVGETCQDDCNAANGFAVQWHGRRVRYVHFAE